MKKCTKAALIIAISLIVAGILTFTATIFTMDFDFSNLDNSKYVTNTYEYADGMTNIKVCVDTTEIKVLPSEDDTLKVVCSEKEKSTHKVTVENYTLIIENAEKKWYDYLTFFEFDRSEIILYLPEKFATSYTLHSEDYTGKLYTSVFQIDLETATGDITVEDLPFAKSLNAESSTGNICIYDSNIDMLKAETDTGDIHLRKVTAVQSLETEVNTGDTTLERCHATDIKAEASTGDIIFRETDTSNNIKVETSTGDITFRDSDGQNIYAKASTGDITGTVRSVKTFKADSSTGKVSVPGTTGNGIFEAKTSTGDIKVTYSEN